MTRTIRLLLFIAVSACLPSIGSAAIVTFNYTATGNGATVTGTFGWDNAVAGTDVTPLVRVYPASGFLTGVISGGPQDGGVINLSGLDWSVTNSSFDSLGTNGSTSFISFLDFVAGTALTSDSLPADINLVDWVTRAMVIASNPDIGLQGFDQLGYNFTSVTLIPLPAAVWLFGSGLLGLIGIARRRKAA